MAKYYVQSGTMRRVVQAESSQKAAIWAVHRAMQQVLPMDNSACEPAETKSERQSAKGLDVLAENLMVSERGFDRPDGVRLATMEVVDQWNELISTLDRLERMLPRAA